ncbi:MAG: site-2 protease family protein [Terracidiphilus sp.]
MQSSALVIAVFEFVLLLFSLSVHECAHAWMASRLGDQTARMMGRVSLNPIDHIDPIGTLLLPALIIFGPLIGFGGFGGILFGWAKPVPIISRNFRKYRRDDMLVSLAGPASNLVLAFISFVGLAALTITQRHAPMTDNPSVAIQTLYLLTTIGLQLNLTLCIFNLLPIPPLDGSHVARQLLPYGAVQVYDRIPIWGSYLLMIFLGRAILGALLFPIMRLVGSVLNHI